MKWSNRILLGAVAILTVLSCAAWVPFIVFNLNERPTLEGAARLLVLMSAVLQAVALISAGGLAAVLRRSDAEERRKIIGIISLAAVLVSLLLAWLTGGLTGASWVYAVSLALGQNSLAAHLVGIIGRILIPLAFVAAAVLLALPRVRSVQATRIFGVAMAVIGLVAAAGLPSQPALVGPATAFAAAIGLLISSSAPRETEGTSAHQM